MIFLIFLNFIKHYKYEYGSKWMKIFYHNVEGGFFINENDVLYNNNENKFSILGYIDDTWKINNYFEFLLEYPEVIGCNIWKQSINPRFNSEIGDNQKAIGYIGINISWTLSNWGGLVKSNPGTDTYLDGSTGGIGYWWYSIGSFKPYSNGIPGPNDIVVTKVLLWIKVLNNDLIIISKLKKFKYSFIINFYILFFYFD